MALQMCKQGCHYLFAAAPKRLKLALKYRMSTATFGKSSVMILKFNLNLNF